MSQKSMVNNAGIFCGQNRIAEESVEAFDKTMVEKSTENNDDCVVS